MIKRFGAFVLLCLSLSLSLKADEGMWLMQQLKTQYDKMRQKGLQLSEEDLYNEQGTALRDAVVIFGRGCTGEVISSQGLVLTNHHCGYGAIQGLSSVQHNYLADGYWAQSFAEELPAKGLSITFIEKIEDVSDYVLKQLGSKQNDPSYYLSPKYLAKLANQKVGKLPSGVEVEIKPFYNGNRYLMFTKKVYSDIRFVGAPPSAIGKFGADTDNWAYPRHTGDFSIFRIYADEAGNPAPYSPTNKPLRPKRWLSISTGGIQEGQFAMVMGFPGRTNRFFLPEEVDEWKRIDNDIRIQMRAIRQEVMLREMLRDPKTNIQYAAKYASSQNAYKRAIGANWGIRVRGLDEDKRKQMQSLLDWAKGEEQKQYRQAIGDIRTAVAERAGLRRRMWYIMEGFLYGTEFIQLPALLAKTPMEQADFYKDFNPEVEKKITKALLTEYLREVKPEERPQELNDWLKEFGSVERFVNIMFAGEYMTPQGLQMLRERKKKPSKTGERGNYKSINEGCLLFQPDEYVERFANMIHSEYKRLNDALTQYDSKIELARRSYVGGLLKQYGDGYLWPDANSTQRFTYGQVRGYSPRDGVYYEPQTYLDGLMAKEDSTSWEFAVPERLKEIYRTESYGKGKRWAIRTKEGKWRMPVNFCATTHTTGGNSGSPVVDAKGNLIGINFDRNWEGVGGDIQYLADYQRSIICDIRYILMIIEEYGRCPRLIDEMSFAQ